MFDQACREEAMQKLSVAKEKNDEMVSIGNTVDGVWQTKVKGLTDLLPINRRRRLREGRRLATQLSEVSGSYSLTGETIGSSTQPIGAIFSGTILQPDSTDLSQDSQSEQG
jgi:hypothetical protein